jgi:acyl transferase domain-containing protein
MSDISERFPHLTPLKQALLALEEMQSKLDALERSRSEPIAIIGMGCRFPCGAKDPAGYWRLLRDGVSAITEVPADRWDLGRYYDPNPETPGKMYTRWGAFLDRVDQFDPQFFGIAPREAVSMDPQQRLLLEVSWEALENAGQVVDDLAGSQTGVFMGICTNEYGQLQMTSGDPARIDAYSGTGGAASVAAGRISYVLGLQGPNLAVDTACSSSLVTVHLACQSLRSRESDLALAGGVNLILAPETTIYFCKLKAMAPGGHCKTFDAAAEGYVRGEGCGVVVLKRLSDALADGDSILALIRGSAVNQDGRSGGLTAPNGLAQEAVIRKALASAGVNPAEVGYVEAHGTGTPLGDPIEVQALGAVLGAERSKDHPLAIGSVKTNLGHLEGAAGIAGLMKVVLALQHEEIPPHLHFKQVNPNISLETIPAIIPIQRTPWAAGNGRRIAGVSSFGFSGTNAHVVLEEAPASALPQRGEETPPLRACLLPMSARSASALESLARSYQEFLKTEATNADFSLMDLCYSAALRRSHHSHRLALVAHSRQQLVEQLDSFLGGDAAPGLSSGCQAPNRRRKVVFVFPGQGSQWLGMGRQLLKEEPVFREHIEACAEAFAPFVSWSLLHELNADEAQSRLGEIDILQPTLFAMQAGLAALWRSWGIPPDAVVGHSLGEVAAAHVAGALSLDDAAQVICRRSSLLRRMSGKGAMAVVELPVEHIQPALEGYTGAVSIAASNSPRSTVISGDPSAVQALLQDFERQGIFCRQVKVDVASHSPQMDPLKPELLQLLDGIQTGSPTVPFYSTVPKTAGGGRDFSPDYWVRNLRQPVHFWNAMQRLLSDGHDVFIEISPHPILLPAIQEGLAHSGQSGSVLSSLRRGEAERDAMLCSLAALYTIGHPIAWEPVNGPGGRWMTLPSYPWQRERFWIEDSDERESPPRTPNRRRKGATDPHPLLGRFWQSSIQSETYFWEFELSTKAVPYLGDHRVREQVVLPAAAYFELVLAASMEIFGEGSHTLEQVHLSRALLLPEGSVQQVQLVLAAEMAETASFQFSSRLLQSTDAKGAWTVNATGTVRLGKGDATAAAVSVEAIQKRCDEVISSGTYYDALSHQGLEYGPSFRAVEQVWRRDGEALGRLRLSAGLTAEAGSYQIHPALLDACLQVFGATVLEKDGAVKDATYLPVGLARLRFYKRPAPGIALWGHALLRSESRSDADRLEADLFLFDDDGQRVLDIEGLQAQRLERMKPQTANAMTDCFFNLQWQLKALSSETKSQHPAAPNPNGRWLVFADSRGIGQRLKSLLESRGKNCIQVFHGQTFRVLETGDYELNAAEPDQFRLLLKHALADSSSPWRSVVHLWSLDAVKTEDATPASLDVSQEGGCGSLLYLVQALAQMGLRDAPRLWLVTGGAQAAAEMGVVAVAQSPAWGLRRVVAHEHPELRCSGVDLSLACTNDEIDALAEEFDADGIEDQIAFRGRERYVARLVRWVEPAPESGLDQEDKKVPAGDQPYRLDLDSPGILDHLRLRIFSRTQPGPGQVEIQVKAAGLNFLDVLSALGIRPDEVPEGRVQLGAECAGIVTALGEGVSGFHIGQEVLAMAPSSFASFVVTPSDFVAPKPACLSFEEAASIPIAFLTAEYALNHLGRLSAGERVLIHAAAGGVGLAAVQLAQLKEAEVLATAGSDEKREFLHSLGISHVMDSRSLAFAEEVMQCTGGQGVDVVLNSLAGEAIPKSLSVLAPYGRFLEIGKRDIYQNRPLRLGPFQRNLSYFAIDLARMMRERPEFLGKLLRGIAQQFDEGRLRPIPLQVFPISAAEKAFRTMAQAQHIGKIVVRLEDPEAWVIPPQEKPAACHADATYLITGGLGGLGLKVAQWMVQQGARHLVLMGRSAPSPAAESVLHELRQAEAQVVIAQADVSQAEEVARVMSRIEETLPPLKGVVHAAGTLDDGVLLQLTRERFQSVMAPKINGAWNLHISTLNKHLDFLVLFSSAASLLGSPGQGNYAAANAFLDALAHHRRAQGLPALSINWGAWAEVGLAAAQSNRGERLAGRGVGSLTPQQGLEALGRLIGQDCAQVGVMELNLRQWRQFFPRAASAPLLAVLAGEQETAGTATRSDNPVRQALLAADPKQRHSLLEGHLRQQLAHVLRLAPTRIDPNTPLGSFGLDSLMALELRNRLEASLGIPLSATLIWSYPTLAALTDHLARQMGAEVEPQPSTPETPNVQQVSSADAASLEELSEDQMAELLAQELARATKGGAA